MGKGDISGHCCNDVKGLMKMATFDNEKLQSILNASRKKLWLLQRRSLDQSSNRSNRSISNSPYHSAENYVNLSCYTCGDIGHKSFNCRKFSFGKWIWRPNVVNPKPQGSKNTWEQTKRTCKKGMWVIDSGCSRHMCEKKENFKTLNKNAGRYAQTRDNAKGEVEGVESITLSSSCDISEVYLVEGLKHNLLSISQICDVGFNSYNATTCTIRHVTKDIIIIEIVMIISTLTCQHIHV
ncbi:hypothetical protein H5410_036546 [Solanum commersonii]|uniref:CCHC-type domain-containing protein n=1 Tax=Solanum commersonii TaxID=4109 RepID=A0A9J5Y5L5_SOLCO|nr:hypothetical protein H5410_036546 [Solanum commersonii]